MDTATTASVQEKVAGIRARARAVVVDRAAKRLDACLVDNRPNALASLKGFLKHQAQCQEGLKVYCLRPSDVLNCLLEDGVWDSKAIPDLDLTVSNTTHSDPCPEESIPLEAFPVEKARICNRARHLCLQKTSRAEVLRWVKSQSYVSVETPVEDVISGLVESGVVHVQDGGGAFAVVSYDQTNSQGQGQGQAQGQGQGLAGEKAEEREQMDKIFRLRSAAVPGAAVSGAAAAESAATGAATDAHEVCDNFDDMNLEETLLRGIYAFGVEKPSGIQRHIPLMLQGKHVVARAECGTGKTLAYVIAALSLVSANAERQSCQAMVLACGREQALQTHKVFEYVADYMPSVYCHCSIGGTSVREDNNKLRRGNQVVVGTTGRLLDSINKGHLHTGRVRIFILDDFDALAQGSSEQAVLNIWRRLPRNAQACCFSAAITPEAQSFAYRMTGGRDVVRVEAGRMMPEALHHFYVDVEKAEWKLETCCDVYETMTITQTIIFCSTNRKVDWLAEQLRQRNYVISTLHSDLDQRERELVMREFRSGAARVLITSALLERSIDVQQVSLVLNYDMPPSGVSYLHRGGRAGRYGRNGVVLSFVTRDDLDRLREVEAYLGIQVQEMPMDIAEYVDGSKAAVGR